MALTTIVLSGYLLVIYNLSRIGVRRTFYRAILVALDPEASALGLSLLSQWRRSFWQRVSGPGSSSAGHFRALNVVWKAMLLKRSSAAGPRSTFIRSIAPSQEARRNSASSTGSSVESISPAA